MLKKQNDTLVVLFCFIFFLILQRKYIINNLNTFFEKSPYPIHFMMENNYKQINSLHTMKQKTHVMRIALVCLFAAISIAAIRAEVISPKKSMDIAGKYIRVDKSKRIYTRSAATDKPFYIYNDKRGSGFVIVAGDDAMGEVLAYSRVGTIDTTKANVQLKHLLNAYAATYQYIKQNAGVTTMASKKAAPRKRVDPLMKSKWDQGFPYSRKTTYVTGCVATAIAQIMYYHKWPIQGRGQHSYHQNNINKTWSADFSQSKYDWDNMRNTYSNYNNGLEISYNAVALLMHDVGVAVDMQYSHSGSGAHSQTAAKGVKEYFDYSTSLIEKKDEGSAFFTDVMRKELEDGFPLYISGNPTGRGEGHAWVADGVDEDDMFHMNFGWSGQNDGFYSLNALSLKSSGKEFQGVPLTFGKGLHVILMHPNNGKKSIPEYLEDSAPNLSFDLDGEMKVVGEKLPSSVEESMQISYKNFKNISKLRLKGDIGIGVYNADGELKHTVASPEHQNKGFIHKRFESNEYSMQNGALITEDQTFSLSLKDLPNGKYYIYPICAALKEETPTVKYGTWCKMKRSPRIGVEIKDKTLRFFEVPTKTGVFQFVEQPFAEKILQAGGRVNIKLAIRKTTGLPFDGKVKISLIDNSGKTIAQGETSRVVDFEHFATTRLKVALKINDDAQPGKYKLKAQVEGNNNKHEIKEVEAIFASENITLDIEDGKAQQSIFSAIYGFVQDNANGSMPTTGINAARESDKLIKFGVSMTASGNNAYVGDVELMLEDTQTGRRLKLNSAKKTIHMRTKGASDVLVTGWIKTAEIGAINYRTYKMVLIGNVNGKEQDLWGDMPMCEVSFKNVPLDDYPTTSIQVTPSNYDIVRNDNTINVKGENIKGVEIYAINGVKITSVKAMNQNALQIDMNYKQPVIVKVIGAKGVVAKKIK